MLWVLIFYGWLDPHRATLMTWVLLVVIATILAIGMSWAHIQRRMSGQFDVDRVDDN